MKKLQILLSLCVLFAACSLFQPSGQAEEYFYDGKWHAYTAAPVSLQINGEPVEAEVPPLLLNDSTLVPARAIFEKLGASVTWDPDSERVGIVMDKTNVILTINSQDADINGTTYKMPIPPKIINDRTMIPVRFAAEALGMEVGWAETERIVTIHVPVAPTGDAQPDAPAPDGAAEEIKGAKIQSIKSSVNGPVMRLTITGDAKLGEYNILELEGPARLVVDIKDSVLEQKFNDMEVKDSYVSKVRAASNSMEEGATRIVADLKDWTKYTVTPSVDGKELYVDFDSSPSVIQDIKFTRFNDRDEIVLGMEYPRTPVLTATGVKGVVSVNIPMALADKVQKNITPDGNFVTSVQVQQLDESTVKLFIVTKDINIAEAGRGEQGVTLTFAPPAYRNLTYSSADNSRLVLKNDRIGFNYFNYKYKNENDKLTVTLPQSTLNLSGILQINDGYVDYAEIRKNPAASTTDIIISKKDACEYRVSTVANNNEIALDIVPRSSIDISDRSEGDRLKDIRDKVIVIDPGHGGDEPGAVYKGPGGEQVLEKDLNLAISLKLYEMLKNTGMNVYITRMVDSTVSLYERADFANNLNASLFVSVHNNWGNSGDRGSMALFNPAAYAPYGISGERLAQIAQEEMLKELGTADKGLWKRPLLVVLNNTAMPSIIAEVAYVSDATDRNNLLTESYQQKAAQALFNTILRGLQEEADFEKEQETKVAAKPGIQETPAAGSTPQDLNARVINGFQIPSLAVAKCEYEGKSTDNPSLFDLTIKIDYSKETGGKATLSEQQSEARQVLLSRLDEATVNKVMEVITYQKDMNTFFWVDSIENSEYRLYVRCLRYSGVAAIDLQKK